MPITALSTLLRVNQVLVLFDGLRAGLILCRKGRGKERKCGWILFFQYRWAALRVAYPAYIPSMKP
jgi:hypothetical protein